MAAKSLQQNPPGAYVYAIVVDGVVRYIGKGTKRRAWSHFGFAKSILLARSNGKRVRVTNFYAKLTEALSRNAQVDAVVIAEGLQEEEAYFREAEEISRAPASQLWNVLEGGIGPTSADLRKAWSDPAFRAKVQAANARPDAKERRAAATKRTWADPASFARRREGLLRSWDGAEERRAKQRKLKTEEYADESARRVHSEKLKVALATPEARAVKRRALQSFINDPTHRAKLSATIRAAWNNPEAIARKSAATKASWADPISRAKRSAAVKAAKSTPKSTKQASESMKRARAEMRAVWERDPALKPRYGRPPGFTMTEEHRKKLSEAAKRRGQKNHDGPYPNICRSGS